MRFVESLVKLAPPCSHTDDPVFKFSLAAPDDCPSTSQGLGHNIRIRGGARHPSGNLLGDLARTATATKKSATHKKLKHIKVQGDGRCMFRALAKGLAYNQGMYLSGQAETDDADELRMAVFEAICGKDTAKRGQYKDAMLAIKAQFDINQYDVLWAVYLHSMWPPLWSPMPHMLPFHSYCQHIQQPSFWGGETELLVLSKMLKVPVVVYLPNAQVPKTRQRPGGFSPITTYGREFLGKRPAVRLLHVDGNHFDLLLTG